jgi:hypothetical protein
MDMSEPTTGLHLGASDAERIAGSIKSFRDDTESRELSKEFREALDEALAEEHNATVEPDEEMA